MRSCRVLRRPTGETLNSPFVCFLLRQRCVPPLACSVTHASKGNATLILKLNPDLSFKATHSSADEESTEPSRVRGNCQHFLVPRVANHREIGMPPIRVLIVDDSMVTRSVLSELLAIGSCHRDCRDGIERQGGTVTDSSG
jgi:hypothetical protein